MQISIVNILIAFVGGLLLLVGAIHVWWLPKHGIHPLTAEPKDKYYALRGWKS